MANLSKRERQQYETALRRQCDGTSLPAGSINKGRSRSCDDFVRDGTIGTRATRQKFVRNMFLLKEYKND